MQPDPTIRAVTPGDQYVVTVEGGVSRRTAVSPGIVIGLPDRDIFLHPGELVLALVKLGWTVFLDDQTPGPAPPGPPPPPRIKKR